ncbi:MAG: diguanylate cyclase [Trueperaceae bacterium]|nr:diguanylate cyclase [Trueperaceae bacterium]
MADVTGREPDPLATIVEGAPPPHAPRWWAYPWATLAGRIYLLILLVTVVLVVLAVGYERRETALRREIQALRAEVWMGDLVLAEVGAFRRATSIIDAFAGHLSNGIGVAAVCADTAADHVGGDPLIRALAVLDAAGATLCHSDGVGVEVPMADAGWFTQALAQEGPVLSGAMPSPRHGVTVMVVAHRATAADGALLVLVAAVDVDALARRFDAAGLPAGSRLTIVDGDGRVAFDATGRAPAGTPYPNLVGAPTDGFGASHATLVPDVAGERRVVAFAPVLNEDEGSLVALSIPAAAVLPAGLPALGRAALLVAALIGVLATIATIALTRLVFRPIRVLEEAMRRVADGDLSSRVAPAAQRGELRTLAAAFDGMTRALRHQRRALTHAAGALAERERELRLLADHLVDLVYAADAEGRITYASASYRTALGYDPERLEGRDPLSLVVPEDADALRPRLAAALARGEAPFRSEVRLHGADGEVHWFELIVTPVADADGAFQGTQGTLREISERKRLEALLEEQALNDPLTGLPNRRYFAEVVQRLLLQAKRSGELVAIGFVDLDDFKAVNDTHGHQAGDVLLREVAGRLRAAVREGDVVARLGGDEFTVALRELHDERHARTVAARVAAAFREPFDLGLVEVPSLASVGVALFPADGDDLEALLRAADHAMYRAKQHGSGSVAFATDAKEV